MELSIQQNKVNGGVFCVFEHNGNHYYADRAYVPFTGLETMIFPCDEEGQVTDWGDLYCDRSGMTLEECVEEFIEQLDSEE